MSLRRAIDAKCKDCIYDPCAPGAWRMQVEACTAIDCPLYAVRPKSKRRAAAVQEGPGADIGPPPAQGIGGGGIGGPEALQGA